MRKKKTISLLLAALMVTTALTGCGGSGSGSGSESGSGTGSSGNSGSSDEKVSLTYTGQWCKSDYPDDNYVETMIEDALNMDITVVKAETADTIDLLLASGEMPDVMWTESKTTSWMYEQELVRTIPKSMVEEYAPDLIKYYDQYPLLYEQTLDPEDSESFKNLVGLTFQFVDYYLPCDYYRYDWIQNLGIDLGVEVTQISDRVYVASDGIELSKFIEIMTKFVKEDPNQTGQNDTVGATGPNLDQGQFYSAYNFHRDINEVNGEAEQYYVMDEYKDYLRGFAELYANNLIDAEIISGDRTLSWDKVNTGIAGYWITSTNSLNSWAVDRPPLTLLDRDPDATILVTPGIKPDGGEVQAVTNASPAYGRFFVNANVDDEKLIKILQFIEYTLFGNGDKDVVASEFYGEKGVDWDWDEAGEMPVQINTLSSGEKGTWSFSQFGQTKDVTKWTGEEELFKAGANFWSDNADGIWMKWQTIPYKADLSNVTNYGQIQQEISSDLEAYVANYRKQVIMGQLDVDSTWEDYLKELDRLGYNKMMDELDSVQPLQEIIDSYK